MKIPLLIGAAGRKVFVAGASGLTSTQTLQGLQDMSGEETFDLLISATLDLTNSTPRIEMNETAKLAIKLLPPPSSKKPRLAE